ncbi:mandelate racemase/muconate lactonizing enzyme family protein [Gilvimarinus agarilyticus]|uniref:mandelate racemase/muconate lactonizing enzyme family protein n=1 Tax=Gilvimarinus sp. 2_MG-2023 TaxID=3062666 RepID=UPI001C08E34F|nr:mandelate racemase/muconate lactonizing enzyme family protein [Gilvimarinus sp. 2_MG-2023]MBU2887513.1 mandelate racemase/muconate lactonizing enzyme family protein [Gilvimarinus agarilyticus]MDO6572164.1 mandelate racemase/muconate lactonizing enzyme family protein [Gilvimarinus sp. 2_MG-2023]
MTATIENIRIHCFDYPRDRVIGDSQFASTHVWAGTLELIDSSGNIGLGFFQSLHTPLPEAREIKALVERLRLPSMLNRPPEALIHKVSRPRGGNIFPLPHSLDQAIDQALWDLAAKHANLPLYQFLGGSSNKVKSYGSGVCFHMSDNEVSDFYTGAVKHGFDAYKVKVGFDTVEQDLDRLALVRDAVGSQTRLMIDANEAWSAKEAIRRIRRYEEAGFPIYWVEDPILRHDIPGLIEVKQALTDSHLNVGEYLDLSGKRNLVDHNAGDIINIHGDISAALNIGWLCAEHGVPISLGNTPMELGAHIASALPEVVYTEHSMLNMDRIVEQPLAVEQGYIVLTDKPGHGFALSASAQQDLCASAAG